VLGASVSGILKLLYQEFATLLLISFVIAVPLGWLTVSNWLQGYPFRIGIQWTYFMIPFVVILVIALLTVSFQSIRAALANPVKSLRTE
jgi:putative ABC transport system permease protein